MARKKRTMPGVNSSSTADMAFILLIFFLTATSMNTDKGLARQLPPPVPDELKNQESDIKMRNVLRILINSQNQISCQGEYIDVKLLKNKAKEFIVNKNNSSDMPQKVLLKDVPFLGDIMATKNHVVSLQSDRGTEYKVYIDVQNEIVAAYNEIRDEFSLEHFNKKYVELDDDHQKSVRAVFPQKISEAEPRTYGGKK
jgi:biopolymer transport protein ExbD